LYTKQSCDLDKPVRLLKELGKLMFMVKVYQIKLVIQISARL